MFILFRANGKIENDVFKRHMEMGVIYNIINILKRNVVYYTAKKRFPLRFMLLGVHTLS